MDCKETFHNTLYMDISSKNLVAVEDLLIAIQIAETDEVVVVEAEAVIDLAEYNLTPLEVEKFTKIFRRINFKLAESFQKQFPATSVFSEIRSKSQPSKDMF